MSAIAGLLPSLKDLLLDLGRSLPWRGARTAGAIFQARETLGLVAPDPLSDHLSRGAPATGCLADARRLVIGGHQPKSCLDPGHSVNFPVGQVCHSSFSFWIRCFHHLFTRGGPFSSWVRCFHHLLTRGGPDLASIFVMTW